MDKETQELIDKGIIVCNDESVLGEELDIDLDEKEAYNKRELEEKKSPQGYTPTKTGKAYKVFRVENGKLYPPMVTNHNNEDTPIGVWLDAEEGELAGVSKTGRPQVKATKNRTLAYRPGWHLGDVPRAPQFDRLNKETGEYEFPKDFVWAECDYAMDVDYQPEADEQGYMRTKVDDQGNITTYKSDKYQHSLAGLKKLPSQGYYKYRTNPNPDTVPWVITGQMKVNKLLDDFEVNKILEQQGIEPIHRQGGDKTLSELGLHESMEETKKKKKEIVSTGDTEANIKTFNMMMGNEGISGDAIAETKEENITTKEISKVMESLGYTKRVNIGKSYRTTDYLGECFDKYIGDYTISRVNDCIRVSLCSTKINEGRANLIESLTQLNYEVLPSNKNIILIKKK